ncbi:MAG: DNA internalization-related competence protein ComEC/Rec2 [Pelosinus sp.]|nr:DNA internalization-related competence protein ComEC/Rec2 [Pelosinus sp.]
MKIMMAVCVAFAAGIWCGSLYTWPQALLYGLVIMAATLSLWCVFKQPLKTGYAVIALFFLIGMLRFVHACALSPVDISNYHEQMLTAYGIISEVPEVKKNSDNQVQIKYVATIKAVQIGGKKAAAAGRMLVYIRQMANEPVCHYGDGVETYGQVFLPHGYNNPALMDSAAALKRQGITARMSGMVMKRTEEAKDTGAFLSTLAIWRDNIIAVMRAVMPEKDAAILAGMLFGGYDGIPAEWVQEFAITGIVHILSVSGTHIALLAGVMLWFGDMLKLRYFIKVLLAAVVIGFYAVFAGLSPPVVRSLVMGLVSLAAGIFGREKDAANALMLSALFLLAVQPGILHDISFQLSFGATAGLVFLYQKTLRFITFLPDYLSGALAVTIAAQLGVLPFIAWYFNSLSLISLAANILVVPIIDGVVVLGLLGVVLVFLVPLAGKFILILCSFLIGFSTKLNSLLATIPAGACYLPAASIWGGMVYYVILAWLYDYLPRRLISFREVWRRWPKRLAAGGMLSLVILLSYVWYPKPLMVHFMDVGQGDAALITTPHGRAILIDTGGTMGDNQFDIGQRVVLPYLKHYGILKVDYLFLTHGHQDHAGGAWAIAEAIPVKFIGMPQEEKASLAILRLQHSKNYSHMLPLYAGLTFVVDGVVIDILHAGTGKVVRTGNETSALIKVSYGKHSFLFTGDLTGEEEQLILNKNCDIASTVLKVGHHGAKTSSTNQFLTKVLPEYAIISAGYSNKFGHPHEEVLKRLSSLKVETHRTDQEGAIVFKTNGERIRCESYIK